MPETLETTATVEPETDTSVGTDTTNTVTPPTPPEPTLPTPPPVDIEEEVRKRLKQFGIEKPETVMETLQKERKARAEAERKAKAFEGIDPELAKKAEKILKEQESIAEREQQIRAAIQSEFEARQAEIESAKKELEQRAVKAETELQTLKVDISLRDAYLAANGFPDEYEAVQSLLHSRVKVDPKTGKPAVYDGDKLAYGKDGKPMSIPQLIDNLKTQYSWVARHFKATGVNNGIDVDGKADGANLKPPSSGNSWADVDRQRGVI